MGGKGNVPKRKGRESRQRKSQDGGAKWKRQGLNGSTRQIESKGIKCMGGSKGQRRADHTKNDGLSSFHAFHVVR
jgi:hypothetical protein